MKRRAISVLLVLVMVLGMLPATGGVETAEAATSVSNRDDGTWLFPLDRSWWTHFTDFAGCCGDGWCYFHQRWENNEDPPPHYDKYGNPLGHTANKPYGHNGVDIGTWGNPAVLASANGIAYVNNTNRNARGYLVVIEHPICTDNNWSYYSIYQHLNSVVTAVDGQYVSAGTVIGYSGGTWGYAEHLHFEILMGVSGHGFDLAKYVDSGTYSIGHLEGQGWILSETPRYREGRIVNNPALDSPSYEERGEAGVLQSVLDHAGSVRYTFEPTEVSVGKGGYTSLCEINSCHARVTVNSKGSIYKLPCNPDTAVKEGYGADNGTVIPVKPGNTFEAVELVKNTEGNYWYKVVWDENGSRKEGYLYSGRLDNAKTVPLWSEDDVYLSAASYPEGNVAHGVNHPVKATVNTRYTYLRQINAYITDTSGNVVVKDGARQETQVNVSVPDNPANRTATTVDTVFRALDPGTYLLCIDAVVENHIATGIKTKTVEKKENICVWKEGPKEFTVGNPPPVMHTVYFYYHNGSVQKQVEIQRHSALGKLPTPLHKFGYVFSHWEWEGNAITPNTKVTGEMHIEPVYRAKTYTVVFDTLVDNMKLLNQNAVYDVIVGSLPLPTRAGFHFLGWYTAKTGGQQVKSDTVLQAASTSTYSLRSVSAGLPIDEETQTLTLYARWGVDAASGVCGENLQWSVDENGVLTITGYGDMYGYRSLDSNSRFPWYHIRDGITKVILPTGLTSITSEAFYGMEKLSSVEIPHTVDYIGSSAFSGCSSLEEVIFYGDQPDNLNQSTFESCSQNIVIRKRPDAEWTDSADYKTKDFSCAHSYDVSVVMPTCVADGYTEHICNRCGTTYMDNPTKATGIHDYVYSYYTFDGWRDRISERCCTCDHYAYAKVSVPSEVDKYYYYGEPLTPGEVSYSSGWQGGELTIKYKNNNGAGSAKAYIEKDGAEAFVHFPIVIPQNLAEGTRGDYLRWAVREDGLLTIHCNGDMPNWSPWSPWEEWCRAQTPYFEILQVEFTGNITSIGDHAFDGMSCINSDFVIPDTVTHIGKRAFAQCNELVTIQLPKNLKSIGDYAFHKCEALETLELPEGLLTIGMEAFAQCEVLAQITVPDSVVSIGDSAFRQCYVLQSITLGSGVSKLHNSAFYGSYFENIFVSKGNDSYCDVDGVLYNKAKTELIAYPPMRQESVYYVPYGVTDTGVHAFSRAAGNDSLKEIHLPASVASVWRVDVSSLEKLWIYGDTQPLLRSALESTSEDFVIYYREGSSAWPSEKFSEFSQVSFSCKHKQTGPWTKSPTCYEEGFSGTICYFLLQVQ